MNIPSVRNEEGPKPTLVSKVVRDYKESNVEVVRFEMEPIVHYEGDTQINVLTEECRQCNPISRWDELILE